MSTIAPRESRARDDRKLDTFRSMLTGGIVGLLLFIICWLAVFIPSVRATHMYIQLFTAAEIRSGAALVEGVCWSLIFGAVIGALIALVYNGLAAISRR